MSDQKIKTAAGKVPLNLIPLSALKGAARVYQHGAVKYAPGNYLTATDDDIGNRYVGGLLRHVSDAQRPDGLFDFASLAELDDESGLPELDHAICGLIMLRAQLIKRGVLLEDPGVSRLVAAVGTDHTPRDVSAPSLESDDPAAIARANAPRGPRYIVVPADDVPPEQECNAEFFSDEGARAWCAKYNAGRTGTWDPHGCSRWPGNTHAVLDTRPTEPR